MGSRKDILKNLGIPEYPWSSDDDEQAADTQQTTARISGQQPIGGSASAGAQQNLSTSNGLFVSRLHSPWPQSRRNASAAGSTSSGVNPYLMSRTTNAPAPEMLGRQAGLADVHPRHHEDIRRVLAFRRLTRNMNNSPSASPRYRDNVFNTIPRRNSRPGTVVPTEANRWPQRGNRLPTTSYNMPLPSHEYPLVSRPPRRRRALSLEGHNSDDDRSMERHGAHLLVTSSIDETEELPAPHIYPLALLSASPGVDHPVPEPETEMETEVETQAGTSNDTSGSGAAVEDAVVEISDEPAEAVMELVSVRHMQSSQTNEAVAVESQQLQPASQAIRRKRRASADDRAPEALSATEFNQKLLRLLECPVCLEWMEPPMSQCRRGHLVCGRCRSRLASCPVCRTTFSSVRNRAMEGVAEMLRYPCRHGCGREVRLRRRAPHEASCAARKYACPVPLCQDKLHLARAELHSHINTKHQYLVKEGPRHRFGIKVNSEAHDNWLIVAMDEVFHVKVDVDIRSWGVIVYVAYIGPKCNAKNYTYEVSIDGQHNGRKMIYRRATHSDLESSSHNVSRQDCFHLSLDQALNFIRFNNRQCDAERILEFEVEVTKINPPPPPSREESDS